MTKSPAVRARILIVDDQASNIEVISEALAADYELFAATTADRALTLAATSVDLVLLDVLMPDVNGFDLCRMLKRDPRTRDIPVIFVTALGDVEDETRGFDAGGVDYIAKPISPAIVQARVRTHLELRAALKRLEREAETLTENLRLKEDVERMSRHDLKTPLTSIIAIPQAMLEEPGLTQDQKRLLRAIETSGYRILEMINRSLDLFRMESGAYEYQPAPVDLNELLDRLTVDLASLARDRSVAIDIPPLSPSVLAEELLTYSMLANLLKNAIEAAPARSRVTVAIEAIPETEHVAISIRNQGVVPLAIRDTFFHKYASSGKKSGTGLGTYSARLMAETQGGEIGMTTSEEHGTVVTVRLTAAAAGPSAAISGTSASPAGDRIRNSRVLIADDDEPTRVVLARFFADARALNIAPSGEDALRVVADFAPDVILLDSEMPGLDGPATARRLRADEARASVPRRLIIGLSAHDDAASREAFLAAGCDLVLVKPVSRDALVDAIETGVIRAESAGGVSEQGPSPLVVVDAELVPLIPAFLESRREQARLLEEALRGGRFEDARALAHKLHGGLEMCGFMDAGAMSGVIEEALTREPTADITALTIRASDLREYLERVRYRAG